MAGRKSDDIIRCSFCNKTQAQVRKMIAGPNGTYICDECVEVCSEIIEEELGYEDDASFDEIKQYPDVRTYWMWKDIVGADIG